MKIHHIVILVLVVSMIALGCMEYITDLGENYGTTTDLSSMGNTSHYLAVQRNLSEKLNKDISIFTLDDEDQSVILIPYRMIQIGWTVAKQIFNSWATTEAMIRDTGRGMDEAGLTLPGWVINSIISIILITLVAILVYAFFKWRFTD